MRNDRSGEYVSLRIKTGQMNSLIVRLENGVSDDRLVDALAEFLPDARNTASELILKGIVE